MNMTAKRWLAGGLIAGCVLLGGCSLLPAQETRRTAPLLRETAAEDFTLTYVTRGDMRLTRKISCTYVPIRKESLSFAVNGEYVDEMFVKPGDAVMKGQLLGQLRLDGVNDRIDECEYAIRTLKLRLSQQEEARALALERADARSDDEAARRSARDAVNADYDARRQSVEDSLGIQTLRLETLKRQKAQRQLFSPIDGTVTYVKQYKESTVTSESERAVTVVDSTMSLFRATTEYWDALPVGTQVMITVRKTEYAATVADEAALGLAVTAHTPGEKGTLYFTLDQPALELEDNDRGSTTITLDGRDDVLMVSEKAVSRAAGQTIVYYQDAEGMKTYKPVELGLCAGGYYEVLSGLSEGEAVIAG